MSRFPKCLGRHTVWLYHHIAHHQHLTCILSHKAGTCLISLNHCWMESNLMATLHHCFLDATHWLNHLGFYKNLLLKNIKPTSNFRVTHVTWYFLHLKLIVKKLSFKLAPVKCIPTSWVFGFTKNPSVPIILPGRRVYDLKIGWKL